MTPATDRPFEVLFLTNFSDACFRAIPALARLGNDVDLRLTILHAHGDAPRTLELESSINSFFPGASRFAGCRRVLVPGTALDAVRQLRSEGPVDLVVAPAGASRSLPRFGRRSLRSRLVNEPGIPVWTFGGATSAQRLSRSAGQVVCCVEIGRSGRAQVRLASEYARSLNATLHLVQLLPDIDEHSISLAESDHCDAADLVAAAHRAGAGPRLAPGVRVAHRGQLAALLRDCDADLVFLDSAHAVGRQWLGLRTRAFVDQLPCPTVCVDGERKDVRWRMSPNPSSMAHDTLAPRWIERPAGRTADNEMSVLRPLTSAS